MQNDPSIYAIVQAIGLLAPNLSLGLIAEGIETPEQEELLLQFGYNIGQGFYSNKLSMPIRLYLFSNKVRLT